MISKIAAALVVAALMVPLASAEMSKKALVVSPSSDGIEWGGCPAFFSKDCRIGVLNGDPAKPNADVFFKVAPGAVLPRHYHTSAERMILMSGTLKITYAGQDEVTWNSGEYAYGPAGVPHEGQCLAGGDPCVLFIAFEEPVDATPTEK